MEENRFLPTPEWPLQEEYQRRDHETIQRWGERILSGSGEWPEEEREERELFFLWLMDAVPRGDKLTAGLIKTLHIAVLKDVGTDMWDAVRDRVYHASETNPFVAQADQMNFETLFTIFKLGKETT